MKRIIILSFSVLLVYTFCTALSGRKASGNSKGFAVIELFSSEGCSSCVSAEELMNKLIGKANSENQPVYILDFHVDYWDYIGWKDTFALHENTARQDAYVNAFKLNSAYTPQAVINGKNEVVGSNEKTITEIINTDLQEPTQVTISCKASKISGTKINVEYTITGTGNTNACVLNIALVEPDVTVKVKKGENAGRTMRHENLVRAFKTIKIESASGKVELTIPNSGLLHSKVVCYVQNSKDLSIVGAQQTKIQ